MGHDGFQQIFFGGSHEIRYHFLSQETLLCESFESGRELVPSAEVPKHVRGNGHLRIIASISKHLHVGQMQNAASYPVLAYSKLTVVEWIRSEEAFWKITSFGNGLQRVVWFHASLFSPSPCPWGIPTHIFKVKTKLACLAEPANTICVLPPLSHVVETSTHSGFD